MRPTWLLDEMYTLADNGVFRPLLTAAGPANIETISSANAQCSVDARPGSVVMVSPNPQKAYRFLPWQTGRATYMELDAGVQLVITGPLSGCWVWAFRSGATTVLVHANANTGVAWGNMTPVQKAANIATKLTYVNAIKGLYAAPATDVARLGAPGARTYEGYTGFVVGCRPRLGYSLNKVSPTASTGSDNWTFYFYGYNGATAADRVLWPF